MGPHPHRVPALRFRSGRYFAALATSRRSSKLCFFCVASVALLPRQKPIELPVVIDP